MIGNRNFHRNAHYMAVMRERRYCCDEHAAVQNQDCRACEPFLRALDRKAREDAYLEFGNVADAARLLGVGTERFLAPRGNAAPRRVA